MEFKINKKIKALLVNTEMQMLTGKDGFKGLKLLAEDLSEELTKQNEDEDKPKKIEQDELFACTGTIGESFQQKK